MEKLVLLAIAVFISGIFTIGKYDLDVETVDLNRLLTFIGSSFTNVWALSLMSVGAGYLSGRAGFLVLVGGILSY